MNAVISAFPLGLIIVVTLKQAWIDMLTALPGLITDTYAAIKLIIEAL